MDAPLFSVVSLLTELLITLAILSVIYRAYYHGVFMRGVAYLALAYEVLVNISYMSARMFGHVLSGEHAQEVHQPYEIAVAIFHGIFSLIMFIALVVFFILAIRAFNRGENFFRNNRKATLAFVAAWLVSVFSGVFLFFLLYG